jgi:ABC-type tungstate transport system substrate-binding protein
VQILGFVKDKHCFSTLSFMKTKFKNQKTLHLDVVIQMFVQNFETFEIFLMIKLLKSGRLPIANMQLMFNYFSLILGNNIFILLAS